jgi:hypothetical protein
MCWHLKRSLRDHAWVCTACGDSIPAKRDGPFKGVPSLLVRGDVDEVPERARIRNKRHDPRLSGAQIERKYAKGVERLRDMKRAGVLKRGKEDCRLQARIPGELFFAKQRENKSYWREDGNLEKHKAWLVDS